jgi:MFS family permease
MILQSPPIGATERADPAADAPAVAGARLPFIARRFPPFTPRQWRVFWISTTAGFFDNYDNALLSLALKQIQHGLSIAEAHVGSMLSAIRLGSLASLLISPLADVYGRRRLLLYTIAGYTIFTGLSALAPHERSFIAAQFLTRAFTGAETTVSLVILAEEVDAAVRGWALGMQGALAISGYGLAAMVFAAIGLIPYGWRGLYALALIPLGLIIPLRRLLPESKRFEGETESGIRPSNIGQPFKALFKAYPGRLAAFVTVAFLKTVGSTSANFFVPKHLQDVHHWSPGRVSSLYVFGGGVGIVGNIVAGRVSDRFGRRATGSIFMAIAPVLAFLLYGTPGNAVIALWVAQLFCDQATITIMSTYSTELFPTTHRAAASSALNVAGFSGGTFGLLLESTLYGLVGSHAGAIRWLIAPWLLAAILMYLLFPETAGLELEQIAPEIP